MLRKFAAALVAASLIAGPALAQSNTPATGNKTQLEQAAKEKIAKLKSAQK